MTWATNWVSSEGKGKLLKVALNDLRGAIIERLDAVDDTLSANCHAIVTGDIISPLWFSTFHSEVSGLILKYINHTDNSGDWDGSATPPPLWTEADILTEIGEARINSPSDYLISAPWLYQQYKILNLLRWVDWNGAWTDTITKSAFDQVWSIAQSKFDAASFIPGTTSPPQFWSEKGGPGNLKIVMVDSKVIYTSPNTSLQHSADIYAKMETPRYIWFNVDDINIEDSQRKIFIISERASGATVYTTADRIYETRTYTYPPDPSSNQYQNGVITLTVVLKFDGANGFTYKDW